MRVNLTGDPPFALTTLVLCDPLTAISAGIGAIGTVVSAAGAISQGQAAKSEAEFQAEEYRRQGNAELASATRNAEESAYKSRLVESRQQALAAASGGSATDETTADLAGDTFQRAALQRQSIVAQGLNARAGYIDKSNAALASGRAAEQGSMFQAAGDIFSGASSFFGKYAAATSPTPTASVAGAVNLDDPRYNNNSSLYQSRYGGPGLS